jgi:hypothetical protein
MRERSPLATSYAKHLFGPAPRRRSADHRRGPLRRSERRLGAGSHREVVAADHLSTRTAGRHRHDRDRRQAAQRMPADRIRPAPTQPQRRPLDRRPPRSAGASPSSRTTRSSSAAPASSSGRRSIHDHALETCARCRSTVSSGVASASQPTRRAGARVRRLAGLGLVYGDRCEEARLDGR